MGISAITRDWGVSPCIVRITTSDTLGAAGATGYLLAQAANIALANNGVFEWLASDSVLVNASDGNGMFMVSPNFQSLNASPSLLPNQQGLTALAGGGQTDATQLNPGTNVVSVVATANDSAQLPADIQGQTVVVTNTSGNSLNVFPALGGSINALSANAALAVGAGLTTVFYGVSATNWRSK